MQKHPAIGNRIEFSSSTISRKFINWKSEMGRFIVFAILACIAYFLLKKIGKALLARSSPPDKTLGPASETELIRDPECGAYFLRQRGVKGVVGGQVIHFCSERCYDKYLKSHSHK